MKSKAVICALAALSMGFSGLALAQDHEHAGPPHREMAPAHDNAGRGAGPDHNFRKGGRLPSEYRDRQYEVNDWRGHHLSAPPRGYHWVQTGPDYVLAAIATGVIAQVLLSH